MLSRVPIRTKLLLVYCLILLPLVGIMGVSAHRQWQQRQEMIFQSHREVAAAVVAALQEFFQNLVDTQEAVGVVTRHHIRTPDAFHAYITEVARANPTLLGCEVLRPDGTLRYSDPSFDWWQSLHDRSDIKAVRSGLPWAVSGLQRAANGVPLITLTTSLPGSSQLLRCAIDVQALQKLETVPLRRGWRLVIIDRKGRLIYHSLDPQRAWEQRDWRRDAGLREALNQAGGRREHYRSMLDGQWCLGSYARDGGSGWLVGSSCPVEVANAPIRAALRIECGQIALAVGISLLLILLLGRQLSLPVERLAGAATRLGRGERGAAVPVEGNDELAVLAHAFNTMADQIQTREEQLREAEQYQLHQRGRVEVALEREQAIATTLQQAFLPQRMPDCPGYHFGAGYHPALREAEVGGDFYDVFPLPDDRIGLLLGDVSGKGLAAAVYATMTRYMVRAYALEVEHPPRSNDGSCGGSLLDRTDAPGELLSRVNRALCESIDEPGLFVTAVYAVLDRKRGTLRYANAGHWPPLLARECGTELVGGHSLALNIVPDTMYAEGQLNLEPGDTLLVFTDGLVELAGDDPITHLEAVQELLGQRRAVPPQELVERIYQDALEQSPGGLRDDVALLALQCDRRPRCERTVEQAPEHSEISGGFGGVEKSRAPVFQVQGSG